MFRRTSDGRRAEHVLAEEISGKAVRLRLFRESVRAGDRVFALMHLTILTGGDGPRVAIRGRVLRVDHRPGGLVAAVVMLTGHRWLFADAVTSEHTRSGGGGVG
jgi:hypothetical protein